MDHTDFEAAGLYQPDAPKADERLALLEYLRDRGATIDELVEAHRLGRLPGVAGDLVRKDRHDRLTPRELAKRVGMPLEDLAPMWRAAGFPDVAPDEPVFHDGDVEGFQVFFEGAAFFGERATLEFTRVVGAAMASIADAALGLFGLQMHPRLAGEGVTELERAQTIEAASLSLQEQVPIAIDVLFRGHVEAAIRRGQIAGAEASGTMFRGAVGFLDLVDSTPLTLDLSARDLMAHVADFERSTSEAVGARDGRVVKHIGDEVMYVTPDAADACEIALELRDRFDTSQGRPGLRGGVAFGDLVRGYGDFYGPLVNLAARAVTLADPGSILVTEEVRDASDGRPGLLFASVGAQALRGFDAPVELFSVVRD